MECFSNLDVHTERTLSATAMQLEPPTGGGGTAPGHAVVTSLSCSQICSKICPIFFWEFPKIFTCYDIHASHYACITHQCEQH